MSHQGWFSGLVEGRRKFTHQQFLNKIILLGLGSQVLVFLPDTFCTILWPLSQGPPLEPGTLAS